MTQEPSLIALQKYTLSRIKQNEFISVAVFCIII